MNVIAWARVSSEEQEKGYSIDAQFRSMKEKAQKAGLVIVKDFSVAESAKRGVDRRKFNAMLDWVKAYAKREKVGAILSHKLDRVCRNMRDAVRLQELEETYGVQLVFVENQFGPGPAGMLSFNVMAAVAQYYSDNLRTEVLKGMEERIKQGWPATQAPYGYMNCDDEQEPVKPHPVRSVALVRIFDLYASGQYTFKSLARKLAAEGHVFRPSQPRFNRTTLSKILNNRFYVGELRRNGHVYRGRYKLLIDSSTFDACQDLLHGKNRRLSKPSLPLSGGLIQCAYCGRAVTGEHIRRKLRSGDCRPHVYYRCANNERPADHPKVRWREADLDGAILGRLESLRWPDQEHVDWFKDALKASFSNIAESKRLQGERLGKRISELKGMQDRLLNTYLLGVVDQPTFQAKSAQLQADLQRVESELEKVEKADGRAADAALHVVDFGQHAAQIWRGSNSEVRRRILESVSLNRVLGDVSLDIEWRKPFDFLANRSNLRNGAEGRI